MASGKLPKGVLPGIVTRLIAALSALGTAGQALRVNAAGTGLEFSDGWTFTADLAWSSGTSLDFTGLPSGLTEIMFFADQLSFSAAKNLMIQLGDAGGFEATGYAGAAGDYVPTANHLLMSSGFQFEGANNGAASSTYVVVGHLIRSDAATNRWHFTGHLARTDAGALTATATGRKALSAELSQLRLTTVAGTSTGDAGTVRLAYK